MTLVVLENCIRCKYTDCVEICPVDHFHQQGVTMRAIHPHECSDCGVCVPECAAEAILAETESAILVSSCSQSRPEIP